MIYAYIFVMAAGRTYLIRMLPLTLIPKKISNDTILFFYTTCLMHALLL